MLLKHYLGPGVSKAKLSRRFGVNRRTIHYWIETGQLDRELSAGARAYAPRPPVAHKLDPDRGDSGGDAQGDAPVRYLVGTPNVRLTQLEKAFLDLPWQGVRQSLDVKLLGNGGELYVLVRSEGRLMKERGRLKKLCRRLAELQRQSNSRDQLMLKLGAAKKEAGRAWSRVDIHLPETDETLAANGFSFRLRRDRLR